MGNKCFVAELQILWRQILRFKESELPDKESEKERSKQIYQSFEVCVIFSNVIWQMHSIRFLCIAVLNILLLVIYAIPEQSAVQSGQIKVPPGYHPIDVEKEWGRLYVSILERERLLRAEFERWETAWTLHKDSVSDCSACTMCVYVSFSVCIDETSLKFCVVGLICEHLKSLSQSLKLFYYIH